VLHLTNPAHAGGLPAAVEGSGIRPDTVLAYASLASDSVKSGRIGDTLMIAEKT